MNETRREEAGGKGATLRRQLCQRLLVVVLSALAVLALERLYVGFHTLLMSDGRQAAVDLLSRRAEVRAWFSGEPVYGHIATARYPPATYALLWPLLSWTTPFSARLLWAAVIAASLAVVAAILLRVTRARTVEMRLLVVLTVAASQPVSYSVGVGQLSVPVLAVVLLGTMLASCRQPGVRFQGAAALLLLFALSKPTLTAPLLWVPLFAAGNPVACLAAAGGYVAATVVAVRPQPLSPFRLPGTYLAVNRVPTSSRGYGNVERWLQGTGIDGWIPAVSLILVLAVGWWVWRNRREDPWRLLAVCAVVARVSTYHSLYDDVLMVVPMAYLMRAVIDEAIAIRTRMVAGSALLFAWVLFLAPARFLLLSPGAEPVLEAFRTLSWMLMLGFVLALRRPAQWCE